MLFNNHKNCDSKQRFSIRKLSIGACSVLLSTLFLATTNAQLVHADDVGKDTGTDSSDQSPTTQNGDEPNKGIKGKEVTLNLNNSATSKTNDETGAEQPEAQEKAKDTEATGKTVDNNKEKASEEKKSSDANSDAQKDKSTPKTNTLAIGKNQKGIDPKLLGESKVNTKDTTVNWSNHRYIMDADLTTHPKQYWNELVRDKVMPWVLKENNNEGATFKSWEFIGGQGTYEGDNWTPNVDTNQGFAYPSGNLVVTNKNGTSTTTYTGITINIAKSIASYFRGKYREVDNDNTVVNDTNAQNTYITVHANSENPFTHVIPNSSIDRIKVGGWTYGEQGDNAQQSRAYLLSIIREIKLTDANISQNGPTQGQFAITFTDGSVLQGKKGNINVVGGVAQTGLTVAKDSDFAFKYPNATSGITSGSQNNIAKWSPTYEWVDKDGNAIGPSNPYNTSANFDAYVKINYKQDGKADGFQIVKVPVTISTTEHVNITVSGDGKQTATYKGSAFDTSNLDLNNFKPSFSVTDGKAIPTPTAGNELTAADYDIHGDPTNVGSYDVYLNANGIAKVKKWNNSNLHIWSNETSVKVGTFTIDKAPITVTIGGKEKPTYNGTPFGDRYGIEVDDENITIKLSSGKLTVPSLDNVDFESKDFIIKDKDGNVIPSSDDDTAGPVNVGTYDVYLSSDGLKKLEGLEGASNFLFPEKAEDIKSSGQIIIQALTLDVNLAGSGTKVYDEKPVTAAELNNGGNSNISAQVVVQLNGNQITVNYILKDGEYIWNEYPKPNEGGYLAGGNQAPKDVNPGEPYQIKLNSKSESLINGITEAINKAYPKLKGNFKFNSESFGNTGTDDGGKFTITPAQAQIKQNGSAEKTYDGLPASVTPQQLLDSLKASLTDNKPLYDTFDTSGLTLSDFDWYQVNADGSETKLQEAPTNAGSYTIKLNKNGLAHFADDYSNNNYSFVDIDKQAPDNPGVRYSGEFKYTIKSKVTFEFVDTTDGNKVLTNDTVVKDMPLNTPTDIALTIPTNYELAAGEKLPTSYTSKENAPVVQIKLVHKTTDVSATDEQAQESRQIKVHYVYGNGDHQGENAAPDAVLNVYFHRTATKDLVTGNVTYGNWQFGNNFNGTYKGMTFANGYSVPEGSTEWTSLPTSWGTVIAKLPTVDGYKAFTNGDWTLNNDNSQSQVPANEFVYPAYTNGGTSTEGGNSIAYTPDADTYEAKNEHTVYFVENVQETRTTTVHYRFWKNGQDAGQAIGNDGQPIQDAVMDIYFQNIPTKFETNGSTDHTKWVATYGQNTDGKKHEGGNWQWNKSKGDASAPGFKVVSGNWSNISPESERASYSAAQPEIINYTRVYLDKNADVNSFSFYRPDHAKDELNTLYTSDAPSVGWLYRKSLTTYYIPTSDLKKTITRTIKVQDPKTGEYTTLPLQTVDFARLARLDQGNGDFTSPNGPKVIFGAQIDGNPYHFVAGENLWNHNSDQANASGTWQEQNIAKPGYIAYIDGVKVEDNKVPSVTVNPDTVDTTVTVTYKATSKAALSGSASSTYNGSPITIDDVNSTTDGNNIKVTVTGPDASTSGTYKLVQGDVEFSSDGQTWKSALPTNAGTYKIRWTADGITHIKNNFGNSSITWGDNDANITSDATYTIKKAPGKATFGGDASKTYDGSAIDYKPTVTVTAPGTANSVDLTAGTDYVWHKADENGQPTGDAIKTAPIDAGNYVVELTDAGKGKIKDLNSANIDWSATDAITGQGSYIINKADATVTFTKNNQTAQSVKYTGSSQFDPSNFVPTIATNNNQTIPVTVNLTLSDFDFYNGTVKLDGEPTAVGNYTVKLNADGLKKLQTESTLNNYNWTNNTSATYVIGKQTGVSVTISNVENGQSEVYKGSAYTNADLNPADFKVTLGNGIEVTLNDAKYWQFVPDQDPTNVGNYKVELSQAGKDYIASQQSGSYEYNFDSTGYGNFEITKATPTVVFNGVGSKTFGQNDTNWSTPTGLTITAPSNPTIALIAEDYEFVGADGTVYSSIPTNAGTYTVRLSAKGKSLITGSNINSANLDWANAKINGEGTFTVKAAQGKAVLSGSNSRDYNGSAVTTTDINNGGTISVSISIPGTDKTVSYKLQDGDYTWKDNADTTNVGTYTIELNKANILAHLQAQIDKDSAWKGNVTIADTDLSGTASFEVKAKAATVSLNGDDTANGPRYNGSAVSTPLDALKNALSSNGTVNGEKLDLTAVTADGFDWYDASGKKLDSAPTDHGVYTIKLNENGLSQIQTKNPNYKISIDKNAYLFKIKTARGSVAFSGSHEAKFGTTDSNYSKDYKVELSTDPATIKDFSPSFALEDKYLEFSTDGKTWSTTVPTAVGTYKVKLNDAARDRIVKDNNFNQNIKWPATNFSGIGSYTVTPAQATASLGGSAKRPYNGSAVTINDINNADSTIGVTINLPNNKTTTYKLVAGDYTWVDGSAPTNVGTYELSFNLTKDGKARLQNWLNKDDVAGLGLDKKPNVLAPTEVTGTASFEITPVAIKVTQGHSDQKTYNGDPAKANISDVIAGISASGTVANHPLNVPTTGENSLNAADFDWWNGTTDLGKVSENNTAPTNAGSYSIKLNNDGLKKLQDANKNYSFSTVGDQYGYTINKATATVSISGTQDSPWTGSSIAIDPSKFPATIKTNNKLSLDIPTGVTLEAGDYEYVDANGNTIAAPSELGQYKVRLTADGWKKLQSQTENYTWSYDNSEGTVNITKATATVTLNGSGSVTYTGKEAQIPYDGSYTVTLSNGKTYTLQAGDLDFVDKSVGANTNVGTYQVKLTDAILTHLGADSSVDPTHYTYELAENNTADLTVTPAEATATINGSGNETYSGSPADINKGNYTIALSNGQKYELKAGDYYFAADDGTILTEAPSNAGHYKVVLTDQGKDNIKNSDKANNGFVGNYNWKFASDATFDITAKDVEISVTGEASKHYDGKDASVDAKQLQNISLNWNDSSTAPSGIDFTLTAKDLEVVDADGHKVKNVNFENGQMTKKYYIRLTKKAIETIKGQSKNYNIIIPTIDQAKTNALYTIYARKAGLTVSGKQDVIYGSPEQLDIHQFEVAIDKDSWVDGTDIPKITLQNGDLEIVLNDAASYPDKPQYEGANKNLPINVGSYTVKITDQLIKRLEEDPRFKDYDFGDDSHGIVSRDPQNVKDSTHNPAVYVVNPKELGITINGNQTIKYGESDALKIKDPNNPDSEGYEISFTGNVSRDNDIFDGFKLQASDLQFVGNKPNDAGSYYVTLSSSGLKRLKEWGQSQDSHFVDNYIWPESFGQAPFEVVQMPVTITIGNAQGTHGQSVVYGQPTTIDNNKYSISVKTEDGKTLEYNLQAGDLQFVTTPTNVGKYQVELSAAGLKNIEDKFGTTNYTYTSNGQGDFEVTAATANITLTGNKESTYNGKTPSLKASDYQLDGLPQGVNFTLQDGDLTFVDADGKPLEKQPVDASATPYHVGLTQAAKDRLKADEVGKNYEWKLDQSKATYTINKATATVSFKNDQDSQTEPYSGETGKFDPSKFVPTITTDSGIPTPGVPTDLNLSIGDGDFEFTKDEVSQTTEPTGQGTYTVKLTDKGMQKIYGENTTNYDWTNSTVGTYTINPISISVSGQGKQDVTYDGTAFGNEDKLDLNKFVPTLNAGTVSVPEIPAGTLTADDYTIKNSKGETVTDPTNAGEYTVWLNENGLNKLKKLSSNFTWPTNPAKVGTLNIAQTDVTAKLSGSNSKTYDGKAVSTADIKNGGTIKLQVTVNGKTYDYALQDGDYTWDLTDGAPTNVGEYTDKIVLDTTGTLKNHLTEFIDGQNKDLEGNFKIDANNLTGSASFNITQKDATVTQGGSDHKDYDGTAGSVTLNDLISHLTSNDLVSGQNLKTSGLTLDDFAWSGTDPNHIAAGDYTIALTDEGLAKLQKDNPNYNISVIGSFKYTIKQATASAELSGSGEKTYNGDPVSDTDIQKSDKDNTITVKVTIPGVKDPQTVTLGVNDFDWSGGKVPTAAGTYTITLNDAGKAAIKDKFVDNKNIDWTKTSFNGSATYTIKKADGKIEFTGSDSKDFDNKEVLPSDLDGNKFYVTVNGQQIALPENGYEIVDANGKKVNPKDAGTYYVVLTDKGLADLEKDTNYSWTPNWNGTTRPNQIGTYVINQLKATPTISGSNSKPYDGQPVTTVEVTKDGKIKVTIDSGNKEFTIPDYVLTDGDYDWYNTDGKKLDSAPSAVGKYVIKLSSKGLQNIKAYLDKTYGKANVSVDSNENSGQASFEITPVSNPGGDTGNGEGNKPTPKPQPTDAKPTKPSDQKPGKPGNKPSKPSKPSKPAKPNKQNHKPAQNTKRPTPANTPKGSHWVNGELIGSNGETLYKNGHWTRVGRNMLPQTGEHDNLAAAILGSLATGLSIFGLVGTRKKKDEDK